MTRLVSYDVFDTLLTRAVGDPTSLFILMGRLDSVQAITRCTPEQFARLRIVSERRSRLGRPETTLARIYTELGVGLALSPDDAQRLCELELTLERRLSRAVPQAADMLHQLDGCRRLAVSDMYLPESFVDELLQQGGLRRHVESLYVSSAHAATKSRGDLYRRIQLAEGVRVRDWRHVGDNPASDVRVPRLLGISAQHAGAAKLNRYESIWEHSRYETGGFSSLIAGASRMARLATAGTGAPDHVRDVAAGVAAPILTAYVLWVLHTAEREGIRRLHFMARDGEILYQLATRLAARLGVDIELNYLYGSRSVFHRATLAFRPIEEATWAWSALYRLGPVDVLTRLGLDKDEAEQTIRRLEIPASLRPVTDTIVQQLIRDDATVEHVRASAVHLLERVQGYLRQEGFCESVPSAIVDTGWAGRIAQSLSDVLPPEAPPLRRGYLFGYMKRRDGYDNPRVLRGYLFDEYARTGFTGHFEDAYGPLETFTVANQGMTVDFRRTGSRFEPILASQQNPALANWPWDSFRETVFRFVDELILDADIASATADLRSPVADVLTAFWSHPTEEESRVWGDYTYEDDLLGSSHNSLAAKITARDFIGKARSAYEGKRLWLQGSVMISRPSLRPAARIGLWFNDRRRSGDGAAGFVSPQLRRRARLITIAAQCRAKR